MKLTLRTLLIAFLLSLTGYSGSLMSQNFAPDGAVWYSRWSWWDLVSGGVEVKTVKAAVIGDTTIDGRACKLISKSYHMVSPEYEYVYEDSGWVYKYSWVSMKWDTLYNFNAGPGESWIRLDEGVVTVDSTGWTIIGGDSLKTLYTSAHGTIIERIGELNFVFWGEQIPADPVDDGPLMCYEDTVLGVVKFTTGPCDTSYIMVGKEPIMEEMKVEIVPNPVMDRMQVEVPPGFIGAKYWLANLLGRVIVTGVVSSEEMDLSIGLLKPGCYFLMIESEDKLIRKKFLRL